MNLPVLDVAIGISFVYLLLSLICTTVNEMIAGRLNTRAKFLDKGITRLLGGDEEFKKLLYKHPLIRSLAQSDSSICPSYIPSDKFATALLDLISGKGKSLSDFAALRDGLKVIPGEHIQAVMTAILDRSPNDAAKVRECVEQWFVENMDRVAGWYKRNAQVNAIILACIITVVLNADTLHIASLLWTTPTLRAAVVEQARVRSQMARPAELLPMVDYPDTPKDPKNPNEGEAINVPSADQALTPEEKAQLSELTGWQSDWKAFQDWRQDKEKGFVPLTLLILTLLIGHLFGWILTAVAVSMGAPFWFDTLNRFMNIRNAGRAPDERRDKSQKATVAA